MRKLIIIAVAIASCFVVYSATITRVKISTFNPSEVREINLSLTSVETAIEVTEAYPMVQASNVTATAATEQTNAFASVFAAAPVVTATYTEDPGDVRSLFIGTVTVSNFICTITADKNFSYVAVGTRP